MTPWSWCCSLPSHLVIGDLADAAVIALVIVVNSAIGVRQDVKADRALRALPHLAPVRTRVLRSGQPREVAVADVVPGDLVMLGPGDLVPADAVLVDGPGIQVDESKFTGESGPVDRAAVPDPGPGPSLPSGFAAGGTAAVSGACLQSGTVVLHGRGLARVTATGSASELGRLAAMVVPGPTATPLHRRMARLSGQLAVAAVVLSLVVLAVGLWRGQPLELMVLTTIALIVAAVPESLPLVVTVSLALAARHMADAPRRGASPVRGRGSGFGHPAGHGQDRDPSWGCRPGHDVERGTSAEPPSRPAGYPGGLRVLRGEARDQRPCEVRRGGSAIKGARLPKGIVMFRTRSLVPAILMASGSALAVPTAAAAPATPVSYPTPASAQTFTGLAMDTCAAPTTAAIEAWKASPYRALGAYIGGSSRTCRQDNLTRDWVAGVTTLGWRILPIYKGLQPPCGARPTDPKISRDPATARAQGVAAADDAVARATTLGMQPGSTFYNDIENYSTTDSGCRVAVLSYASGWTQQLHRRGYVSGIYVNLSSGAQDLSAAYSSTSYARPDALWVARYDGNPSLSGWTGIANTKWSNVQRAKQYRGDQVETYGGVSMNIDSNVVNAPVATVARPFRTTSNTRLNGRSGPTTSSPVVATYPAGSTLSVVCQAPGSKVGTTNVWDKLTTGAYVTDFYMSTPSKTTYSTNLPRCRYPYQVTSATGVNKRSGPGSSYPVIATFAPGALAWATCQTPGSLVGTTKVWDHLAAGGYVTDYYLATPNATSYSSPLPRC